MTYDPNVYGYVDGQPTYSRDEFIYKKRRRGPITDDAELVAFAEKATSGWYNAGWRRTFTTYYLGDYALSEPLDSKLKTLLKICVALECRLEDIVTDEETLTLIAAYKG